MSTATPTPIPTALIPGPLWVTDQNHGPVVSIITWFLIITSFLSVAARVATRLAVVKKIFADDITIMVALLLSIGQSICVSLEVTHGLGKPMDTLSSAELVQFQKDTFASNILYVAVITLVKISVCLYLMSLTPVPLQRNAALATGIFTCLWGVSAIFVIGFQCSLPQTWNVLSDKCINLETFWAYVDAMNIVTDLPLVILPAVIISRLQANMTRKAVVIGCFGARVLVIGASAAQLFYLHHDIEDGKASNPADITFHIWRTQLCTQVVIFLSFLTACIPYLKPLIEAMEHGMTRADDLRRRGISVAGYGQNSNGGYGKMGSKMNSKGLRMENLSDSSKSMHKTGVMSPHHNAATTTISALTPNSHHKAEHNAADDDGDSQSSQSKIIKKTMTFNISEEPQTRVPDYINGGYAR